MNRKSFFYGAFTVATLIVVVIILVVGTLLYVNKKVVVYQDNSGELFVIMIEDEDGTYFESPNYDFPTTGYTFNSEKSYCVNGSTMSYGDTGLTVATSGSDNCYVYFDIYVPIASDTILANNGGKEVIEAKGDPNFTVATTSSDTGMYAAPDDYGTSYYFRGLVDNNHLYFNGIYWRIVRINGDESIRLIYNGTEELTSADAVTTLGEKTQIGTSVFNSSHNNNAYVGYMYTIGERQGLSTSSTIKTYIENWYSTNMSSVDSMIADNLFCYDRGLATGGYQNSSYGSANGVYSGTGIHLSPTLYRIVERITASSSSFSIGGTGPSLECMDKVDAYTVDDEVNGNGTLTEKVGLLNTDEASFAGHRPAKAYAGYLKTGNQYLLGNPYAFISSYINVANMWSIDIGGNIYGVATSAAIGVRPVISLNSDVKFKGTGEWDNPYTVINS